MTDLKYNGSLYIAIMWLYWCCPVGRYGTNAGTIHSSLLHIKNSSPLLDLPLPLYSSSSDPWSSSSLVLLILGPPHPTPTPIPYLGSMILQLCSLCT